MASSWNYSQLYKDLFTSSQHDVLANGYRGAYKIDKEDWGPCPRGVHRAVSDNQAARNKNNRNVGIKSNDVRGLWPTCLYRDVGWDKLSWCLSIRGQGASGDSNGLKVHYSRRLTWLSSLDMSIVLGAKEGRSMLCLDLFLFLHHFLTVNLRE